MPACELPLGWPLPGSLAAMRFAALLLASPGHRALHRTAAIEPAIEPRPSPGRSAPLLEVALLNTIS